MEKYIGGRAANSMPSQQAIEPLHRLLDLIRRKLVAKADWLYLVRRHCTHTWHRRAVELVRCVHVTVAKDEGLHTSSPTTAAIMEPVSRHHLIYVEDVSDVLLLHALGVLGSPHGACEVLAGCRVLTNALNICCCRRRC